MSKTKAASTSAYKKLFICDVHHKACFEGLFFSSKWQKIALLGSVVAIKEYPERFVYTVDDGTGLLDCSIKKDTQLKEQVVTESASNSKSKNAFSFDDLKDELNSMQEYIRGDAVVMYGQIDMAKSMPRLEVTRHYKVRDPNEENAWMAEQLSFYQGK